MGDLKKDLEKIDKNVLLNEKLPEDLRMGILAKIKPKELRDGKIVFSEDKKNIINKLLRGAYVGNNRELSEDLERIRFDLSWVELPQANLKSLNFQNVNFSLSSLDYAHLTMAILTQANLSISHLNGTDFSQATMTSVDLSLCWGNQADFSGANLQMANVRGALFTGANFTMANLSMADFSDCDLSHARFEGATITGVNVENSNITGTIFEKIIENEKEEKKYGTDSFSSTYHLEEHRVRGDESIYAKKHHYVGKNKRYG